jgi:formyltetrahydrofolate hydrolase
MGEYDGTITSKLRPVVTTLTEALVKDFELVYQPEHDVSRVMGKRLWMRTDVAGEEALVDDQQLWNDVRAWLLNLEEAMTEESDKKYAQMVVHMVSKNPGWITLLTNRLLKRLS